MRSYLVISAFVLLAMFTGLMAAQYPPATLLYGVIALAIFIVAFVNIELGLYVLIFSMLLSPEFLAGETAGGLGRGVTLRLEDFLLVIIGFSWLAKNAINKELGLFLRTPLNKPIFYYILACTVSTGIGIIAGRVDPKTGFFFVVKYFEYFIVYFMMVNHVENIDQVKRFLFCLFLTCFIVSMIGMYQIPAGGRVSAPFEGEVGEPNTFGGYLVFLGAMAAGLFFYLEKSLEKKMLAVLIFSILPPFLFTQSRASYLAAIPMVFVLGYLMGKRLIAVILILAFFILSPFLLPSEVKNRIAFTFTQREHKEQIQVGAVRLDTSTSARINSWKNGLKDWVRHPILGYGVTGYSFMDAQFPKVLVETGIVGLVAFIYLLYSIGKIALTNIKTLKIKYFRGISIGFFAGFIGLLFHAIGANTFIIVRIMEPFWFFAGILVVLPELENKGFLYEEI